MAVIFTIAQLPFLQYYTEYVGYIRRIVSNICSSQGRLCRELFLARPIKTFPERRQTAGAHSTDGIIIAEQQGLLAEVRNKGDDVHGRRVCLFVVQHLGLTLTLVGSG